MLARLGADGAETPNLLRRFLAPGPQRAMIVDWEGAARVMLRRLRNEQLHRPDEERQRLLDEVATWPGVPTDWAAAGSVDPLPVFSVAFEAEGVRTSWFTTVTTLGTPQDVTLQELTIESFFPRRRGD